MKMPNKVLIAAACCVCFAARCAVAAEVADWRSWRGPLGSSSLEQGNFPVTFAADKYLWRAELPGRGCSTPIVLNGMIYLTSPADGPYNMTFVIGSWDRLTWPLQAHVDYISEMANRRTWSTATGSRYTDSQP